MNPLSSRTITDQRCGPMDELKAEMGRLTEVCKLKYEIDQLSKHSRSDDLLATTLLTTNDARP